MPPFIAEYWAKFLGFWSDRTVAQRILIGGLAVSVSLSFVLMVYWMNKPDYKLLMTNLYPEDASRVVGMLQAQKEQYQLTDNGKTILVPADRVYELRLKVAGEGNLHGQGIGFEIFDSVQIGQTDFVQHINYQRALQGNWPVPSPNSADRKDACASGHPAEISVYRRSDAAQCIHYPADEE